MSHIEVYSSDHCPWCSRAKILLQAKGLDYEEINIYAGEARALEMIERSDRRTVPQIFIDDEPIGGYQQLAVMNQAGKLDQVA